MVNFECLASHEWLPDNQVAALHTHVEISHNFHFMAMCSLLPSHQIFLSSPMQWSFNNAVRGEAE